MRTSVFLLLLIAASWAAVPAGYYEGRSGNIILEPKNLQNSKLLLINSKTSEALEIPETQIGNLIAHLLGLSPLDSNNLLKTDLKATTLFRKSAANLFVALDSLTSDLENLISLRAKGQVGTLLTESFPNDGVSALTTFVSSLPPASHGIIGATWPSLQGPVSAYHANAVPSVPSVADSLSLAFSGQSLTVAFSGNFELASAMGVHQYLHHSHPTWNNYAYFYSRENRRIENVYSSSSPSGFGGLEGNVHSILAKLPRFAALFNSPDLVASFDASSEIFSVQLPENLQVSFNLKNREDWLLFVELTSIMSVMESLNTEPLSELVRDQIPDSYFFAISALKEIQRFYGIDSAEAKAAMRLIDAILSKFISVLVSFYGEDGLSGQVVSIRDLNTYSLQQNIPLKNKVNTILYNYLDQSVFDSYFPAYYLEDFAGENNQLIDELCEEIRATVEVDSIDVHCFDSTPEIYLRDFYAGSNSSNGTVTPALFPKYAQFNIILYTSIGLILILYWIIYSMFTMEVQVDSLLYKTSGKLHTS